MARKKFIPKEPKYKIISVSTKVLTLDVIKYPDGKCKSVFDCESPTGTPRRCVYWEFSDSRTSFTVGDAVTLTGRIINDVFLVYKLLYDPKKRIAREVEDVQTG